MTWSRQIAAAALADTLRSSIDDNGDGVTVFERPPATLNVPALVISRQPEVAYGDVSFGVDSAQLPVVCLAQIGGEDVVDELVGMVLDAIEADPMLGGAVRSCTPAAQRNWRGSKIGGVDVLSVDVVLDIQM